MRIQDQDDIYYFFMKVGFGNCFLQQAEQLNGLWVGYAGDSIPQITPAGICELGPEKSDLRYMALATSDHWRDRVRIVIYGKDALTIWKPTAPIRYLTKNDGGIDWTSPGIYQSFDHAWKKSVIEKHGQIGSDSFNQLYFGDKGFKLIPTELVEVVSRDRLIAPVDSLAVWQHFVRNTFQPIFTLAGSDNLAGVDWLKRSPELPPMPITKDLSLREGMFGRFVRYYLNSKTGIPTVPLAELTEQDRLNTALGILNPAQMETAAMLLCQDLGLSIDVGLGKGLDVVDVKATARHKSDSSARIKSALEVLKNIGVRFTPQLHDMIVSSRTLRIQCKAGSGYTVDGSVLLFEPDGDGAKSEDRLTLAQIIRSNMRLPALNDWITLLTHDLG